MSDWAIIIGIHIVSVGLLIQLAFGVVALAWGLVWAATNLWSRYSGFNKFRKDYLRWKLQKEERQ